MKKCICGFGRVYTSFNASRHELDFLFDIILQGYTIDGSFPSSKDNIILFKHNAAKIVYGMMNIPWTFHNPLISKSLNRNKKYILLYTCLNTYFNIVTNISTYLF